MINDHTTLGQRLRCSNDANGNPRRLYVFYESNGTVAWLCAEQNGAPTGIASRAAWKHITELPNIEIRLKEYWSWLDLAKERGYVVDGRQCIILDSNLATEQGPCLGPVQIRGSWPDGEGGMSGVYACEAHEEFVTQ